MKLATFRSFRPADATLARYVDYYYLDCKPDNEVTTFDFFPHYNNTPSTLATGCPVSVASHMNPWRHHYRFSPHSGIACYELPKPGRYTEW